MTGCLMLASVCVNWLCCKALHLRLCGRSICGVSSEMVQPHIKSSLDSTVTKWWICIYELTQNYHRQTHLRKGCRRMRQSLGMLEPLYLCSWKLTTECKAQCAWQFKGKHIFAGYGIYLAIYNSVHLPNKLHTNPIHYLQMWLSSEAQFPKCVHRQMKKCHLTLTLF